MIKSATINDLLIGKKASDKLQQGWSPQCDPHPAKPENWGVLKTTAIQPGKFIEHENKNLPDTLEPRQNLEVRPGDLLLTCAGPRVRCGVPAYVRTTREKLIFSGKMYRFRPDPHIMDPRFLELYLLSPRAQRSIDAMKTGINESGLNLTKDRFLSLSAPVCPIDKQHQVVEILEDHLSRLNASIDYLHAAFRRSENLVESRLLQHFSGPPSSECRQVGDLIIESRGGWSRSRDHIVSPGSGVPYLKMNNINRDGSLDLSSVVEVSVSREDLEKYTILPGDVMFNSKNSGDLIGKTLVADESIEGWVFNENIMRLRFLDSLDPEYVGIWFLSPQARRQILSASRASTNVAAVYAKELKRFTMWTPDEETQRKIIGEYRQVREASVRVKAEISKSLDRSERLRKSLLDAAFSGRLTGAASDIERAEELAEATTPLTRGVLF